MQFTKNMKEPESIPSAGIDRAVKLMTSGRLYRYNFDGEVDENTEIPTSDDWLASEVAQLEADFCQYTGHKYAIAVNSCGSALFLSLKAAGVKANDKVFTNAFTFTAVPSSIIHANGIPVYVECTKDYVLDIEDFRAKVKANPDVKFMVVSHMRGHISDMTTIQQICETAGITLIEDCAHSLGAKWSDAETEREVLVGHHGKVACFSSQSYKLLNSGEGGLIATDDERIAAYCILGAGSYEKLYRKHLARPQDDSLFESMKQHVPNFSLRMNNLTASVIRPQIPELENKISQHSTKYDQIVRILDAVDNIYIPTPLEEVTRVADSLQFNLINLTAAQIEEFITRVTARGIKIQVFGGVDNARNFKNWCYSFDDEPQLEQTDSIITKACDVRLALSLSKEDVDLLGFIIKDVLYDVIRDKAEPDYKNGLTTHFESTQEIVTKYDDWAMDYDAEHYRNGWTILLNKVAYTLLNYLDVDSHLLDVGCGTGLLARELFAYGLNNIDGMDISKISLEQASELNIYKGLHYGKLGEALSFGDGYFDALVSSGVFTRNQVPLNSFEELTRILKPQGILAIVVRVEDDGFYDKELERYCAQNILTELDRVPIKVLSSCRHELIILRRS